MNTVSAKKYILGFLVLAFIVSFSLVSADGAPTPTITHSPYDTGFGDSINMDTTLVIGASLYGIGVLLTSSSKALLAKFGTKLLH